jgi:hypothetical protein
MSDIWICPHCGHENEDTERIALKESCRRCKEERITPECLEEYISDKLDTLDSDKGDVVYKLSLYDDMINYKMGELSDLKSKRKEHEDEYHRIEKEQIKLKSTPVYTEKLKVITKDQRYLDEFGRTI